jgi:hypothetical protein
MILLLIETIDKYNMTPFINDNFKSDVENYLKKLLPQLNALDMNILLKLTLYMIFDISTKYNFPIELGHNQWTKNNGRDISSLSLSLIPYIGDNSYDIITKLTDIIFKSDDININKSVLEINRNDALKKFFPFSNFTLGLLNENNDILLDLYKNNQHTIYDCIENNFYSMLETIKITNGKLYVNWLNVIPNANYKNSIIYKNSIDELDELRNIIQTSNRDNMKNNIWRLLNNNKGLWLGDYYNVLAKGYFYSVKKVKWLLFCRRINNNYFYMIQYLRHMIDLSVIFKYNDYNSMDEKDIIKFEASIKSWYLLLKNNTPIYLNIDWEFNLLKNLLSFMCFNYSKAFILDDIITDLFENVNVVDSGEELDPIDIDIKKIRNDGLINALNKLKSEHLWEYLKECFTIFEATPYAKYLIIENTDINMTFFNLREGDRQINLKNIYNIAKACSHDTLNNQYTFMSNFKSLDDMHIIRFFILFSTNSYNLINIRKNIQLQEVNNYNYTDILNRITNGWLDINIDLVWDYLSENGLLSEFNINLELTDDTQLQSSDMNVKNRLIQKRLKLYIDNNKQLFESNYFLTNKPYNKLEKYGNSNYLSFLTGSTNFYTFYANDWISQLNFFNHYINHSVLYVTGSTGTGKSTQVPKLTMYALKMYDYKNNGSVICTQPRIPPTQDNAKRISKEMGVNIVDVKDRIEFKTNMHYIQYKHMKDSHIKKYNNHLTLKMVTDGTLLEELVNNPMLKKIGKLEIENFEQRYILDIENLYDIVMVDEAHEHNTNMDVILTLMRQTCMYNNSTRLIIVSATMDDDEPIYRSYYKLINDNIVHPIKQPITNLLSNTDYFINSYYLDRRIHISVPKQSYSYKITEYYDEDIEKRFKKDDMKYNANIAQEQSYEIIKMICNKSIFGDILLFSIGKEEIKSAVRSLNKIIPASTIALPFYSEMNYKYRDIISDIDITIGQIRNKKENITEEWAEEFLNTKDVPENTYKRAIIIATNVAEASITISSLRYVVDTGFAKVNRYDVITDTSNINVEHISESSRIQRKGRIGRVAEGTVYYIYGKNKRLNVKPKYGITLGDFHGNFIKLSSKNVNSDKTLFWEPELNPYLYEYFNKNINIRLLFQNVNLHKTNVVTKNIYQILLEQFLILNRPIASSYFYNFNELSQEILPNYLNRVDDGYTYSQLIDLKGEFYIIHPYENILTRNIMGQIINYNNNSMNKHIYDPMLFNIQMKLFYLPINYDNNDPTIKFHKKTDYFEKISEIMNITKFEEKDATILLLACGYDLLYESCEIICMLHAINNNITSLIYTSNKNIKYEEMRKIFGSDSDVTSIYMVCKLLREKLNNMLIYSVYNNSSVLEKFRGEYINILKEYKRRNFNAIKDSVDLMNWLYNNGKLDTNKGFLYWIKSSNRFKNELMLELTKYSNDIYKICEQFYLNYDIIIKYYENLIYTIINILSAEAEIDEDYKMISVFKWAKKLNSNLLKVVTHNTIEEKLNLCFFISQPLYFSVMFTNGYKNLNNEYCNIKPFIKNWLNTLCINISSYIGYYNFSNNNMSIIYNINISKITSYYPIFYNPYYIKNINILKTSDNVKIIQYNSDKWNDFVMTIKNTFSNLSYDRFPLNSSELPTIQEYIKQIKHHQLL